MLSQNGKVENYVRWFLLGWKWHGTNSVQPHLSGKSQVLARAADLLPARGPSCPTTSCFKRKSLKSQKRIAAYYTISSASLRPHPLIPSSPAYWVIFECLSIDERLWEPRGEKHLPTTDDSKPLCSGVFCVWAPRVRGGPRHSSLTPLRD